MPEKVISAPPSTNAEARVPTEVDFQTDSVTIPVKLCNLPPFHSVANQVLSLSADPDIDMKRLAAVMEKDPAFAAEVLLLANSSLFGFTSRMHVLRHAVAVLGLDRIKALAVTVAMRAFLGNSGPVIGQCWRHSAACAIVSEEIGPIFDISGDRAYTAGLMHDIGRLGLLKAYAKEVSPVMTAEYGAMSDVLQAERAAINVDHGTAGAWLVKTWAFPDAFQEVCAHHHDRLEEKDAPLLQMAKAACCITDALGYSAVRYRQKMTYGEFLFSLPPFLRKEAFPAEEVLQEKVATRLSAFEQ